MKPYAAPTPQADHLGFATVLEAAQYLRLSKSGIHKLIVAGKIPARHYGRAVRISWSWLKSQAEAA